VSSQARSLGLLLGAAVIHGAGRALNLRQQVIATAIVYFRRFYTRNSFRQCDPLLVGPTCLYLACKVEECTPTPASNMIERIRSYGTGRRRTQRGQGHLA